MEYIYEQASAVIDELLTSATTLRPGDIVVIGCSTSEVGGYLIGSHSSEDIAKHIMDAVLPKLKERQLYLAVQCCEHLNRSMVVERACMERYDLTQVWVRPQLHAGGAFAMQAVTRFEDPVIVEDIRMRASAGIDIGGTLIGMHLKKVAVPVRLSIKQIGEAPLICARTRPKFIGGSRAVYDDALSGGDIPR